MRDKLQLRCTTCKEENYIYKKNKSIHPEKLKINKYCWKCNTKTAHEEKKK